MRWRQGLEGANKAARGVMKKFGMWRICREVSPLRQSGDPRPGMRSARRLHVDFYFFGS